MTELLNNFSITETKKQRDLESLNGMTGVEKAGARELISGMMISEEPWITIRGIEIIEKLHGVSQIRVDLPVC